MPNPSLNAFKRTVTVNWPAHQQAAARAHLIKVATQGHAATMREQTARNGVAPDFDRYANTPGNTNLETVKLPGPIVFRYRYVREVVTVAMRLLDAASPTISGDYKRGHTVFLNGVPVAPAAMPAIKASDEVIIANAVPYARRIEIGKTKSGRDFVIQVPNRIYERAAAELKRRFGRVVNIRSQFVSLPDAYKLRQNQKSRSFAGGKLRVSAYQRRDRVAGSAVTYPAIVVQVLQ